MAANFGTERCELDVGGMRELLLSNCGRADVEGKTLTLYPCESAVVLLWA